MTDLDQKTSTAPSLLCSRHGEPLDDRGDCSKHKSLSTNPETSEEKYHRILSSIVRSAHEFGCEWTQLTNAVKVADLVGLTPAEVKDAIEQEDFHRNLPLLELTEEEQKCIERLAAAGLNLHRCETGPFRHGYLLWKPIVAGGNKRLNYRHRGLITDINDDGAKDDNLDSDAPNAWLYPSAKMEWYFMVSVHCGGVGPGDFLNKHQDISFAADDILDYYFGNPQRMNPPDLIEHRASQRARSIAEVAEADDEMYGVED